MQNHKHDNKTSTPIYDLSNELKYCAQAWQGLGTARVDIKVVEVPLDNRLHKKPKYIYIYLSPAGGKTAATLCHEMRY